MLTSANTCRTGRSVLETAVGQPIVLFEDLRLTGRVLASESEEADFILVQVHFTTDQAVGPGLAQRPGLPQQGDLAQPAAASEVDHPAAGAFLQLEPPAHGEGAAVRGGLDPCRPLLEQGSDVPLGVALQVLQVLMREAGPDLGLPPAVV